MLLNERDVEEQSHKDEMRAALKGDFERLRERRGGETETASVPAPPAPVVNEVRPDARSQVSWLERLFARG